MCSIEDNYKNINDTKAFHTIHVIYVHQQGERI